MAAFPRRLSLIVAASMCLAAPVSSAGAAVTPTADATAIVSAMAVDPGLVTGATFLQRPPTGTPSAVATTTAARFPTFADSYAVLSTGSTGGIFGSPGRNLSGLNGGEATRGDTSRDVTVLKVDVNVPPAANCLGFDLRFLSEEYPEYPGKTYNDAFVAELDVHDWTTIGSRVIAPHDFAFRTNGTPLNIRTTGATSADARNAAGTRFDGATPLLRAWTPVAPGAHSLYLSIFDQGDPAFDSAVFLDRLVARRARQATCGVGAFPVINPEIKLLRSRALSGGRTEFRARVSSESGIARVIVRLDGKVVYGRPTFPDTERNFVLRIPVDTAELRKGTHRLQFRAVNRAGGTTVTRTFRR